ncbi:MAG: hypothetical protein F7C08_00725 [Desulfurococcales archaeon]|nr:hypothetical protein [Desulfurococcales archaeon]MCE4605047.1 hypothetical protein [Desulfurococcales archaeon]
MRILLLHAERFEYETLKKALKTTPDPPGRGSCSNCLVVMATVEEGDTSITVMEAVSSILDVLSKVKADSVMLYPYAHLSSRLAPPNIAVDILKHMETLLSNRGVKVERSPFGWYKRFSLTVYGHPLSELSREIVGDPLYYNLEEGPISLREAVSRGLLPSGLSETLQAGDTLEVLGRLGLYPLDGRGEVILGSIIDRLTGGLTIARVISGGYRLDKLQGLELLTALLYSCAVAGSQPSIIRHQDDVVVKTRASLEEALSGIYNYTGLMEAPLGVRGVAAPGLGGEGRILLYKMRIGPVIPIGAEAGGVSCIGPLRGLVASIVDSELARREADDSHVPQLPPWMHFVHVALIPVSDGQKSVAMEVASLLARSGARVAVLDDTSTRLGARIRRAARLWVPIVGVIGEREAAEGVVTVRRRWEPGGQEAVTPGELVEEIQEILGSPRLLRL